MPGIMFEEISYQKPANIPLEKDPNSWIQAIHNEFSQKSKNDPRPNKLEIKKEEVDNGAMFGWITVINNLERERKINDPYNKVDQEAGQNMDDSNIYFPVVIKNWQLSPMDIFMYRDKFWPTSETNLNMTKDSGLSGRPMEQREDLGVLSGNEFYDQVRPDVVSTMGRYSTLRNLNKYSSDPENRRRLFDVTKPVSDSMIRRIADTIDEVSISKLSDEISSDRKTTNIFNIHAQGFLSGLKKIATAKKEVPSRSHMTIIRDEDTGLIRGGYITKEAALSGSSTVKSVDTPKEDIDEKFRVYLDEQKAIRQFNQIMTLDDKVVQLSIPDYGVVTQNHFTDVEKLHAVIDEPIPVKKLGCYEILTERGVPEKGLFIPHVIDFDMDLKNAGLFVTESGDYVYDKNLIGVPVDDKYIDLKEDEALAGNTGILTYSRDGNVLTTEPFKIIASISTPAPAEGGDNQINTLRVMARDGSEKVLLFTEFSNTENETILKAGDLEKFRRFSNDDNVYLVPKRFKFRKLNLAMMPISSPEQVMKVAEDVYFRGRSKTAIIYDKGLFSIHHPFLEKEAAHSSMDENLFMHTMTLFGCNPKIASDIMKEATDMGFVEVVGLRETPFEVQAYSLIEKEASDLFDVYIRDYRVQPRGISKVAGEILFSLKRNYGANDEIKKIANEFDKEYVLDTMLSLNFINRNNLIKFAASVPLFNKCVNILAEMLFISRIGEPTLPEGAITTAMNSIGEAIKGLEALKRKIV